MGIIFGIILLTAIVCFVVNKRKSSDFVGNAKDATIFVQDKYKDCLEYNEKEQELVVNKQSTYFKICLSTKPHKENNYGYEEEKYVYTGATVGGISMGGIHKTGGHYYKQNKTSKVQFVYYFYDPQKNNHLYNIKKIRLNNKELIEKAEKSSIRRYLKNDCIMIEEEISAEDLKKLKDSMVSAADAGNMNMARNINSYITTESLPTKEKCIAIINWLSTCD